VEAKKINWDEISDADIEPSPLLRRSDCRRRTVRATVSDPVGGTVLTFHPWT
jgi:hypothetical protein